MKMDNTDIKILMELQSDSRLSIRELSKRVNLSPPSVTERIRKLEDVGIIEGYTIKINEIALGLSIQCIIQIDLKNSNFEKFKKFIYNHPRVVFCYRIAGHSCILLKLSVESISEIEKFVDSISSLDSTTSTHIIFSEVPVNQNIGKFFSFDRENDPQKIIGGN
ncbi:Lrp/AsnC family transcriptional regulator [Clostridium uliginosum]|uniref:Lrp/AsnC family transcriptional regulator, leucine-responsive regulatory protein n=1 Tax=Clostridium uliginosum TaxID=119641 RepID=A0A1I1M0X3_9CLOT|nr:Lrp/AsnC family transcriptional regulator [Clostridium uliginosum]SFC76223.1 Lrp/AsnC family transcriptional regulator, leucine-responsive regulatory protein [Clostridium uliginosum]